MAEFTDTLRDLVGLYRESLTMPVPSAVDTTMGGYGTNIHQGSGGHGTHGERGRIASFGADAPFSVRFERWLEKALAVWRYEMDRERQGVEKAQLPEALVDLARELHGIASTRGTAGKTGKAKRAEDKAILATMGDPIIVGLLFGRTSEAIRKLRERDDRDPHTGDRLPKPKPLTSRELPDQT